MPISQQVYLEKVYDLLSESTEYMYTYIYIYIYIYTYIHIYEGAGPPRRCRFSPLT